MKDTTLDDKASSNIDYLAVADSPEFRELKRRHRRFTFPLAVVFLAWYFTFVLLAAFAPEFMGRILFGQITIGLVLGLLQFVTTFAITMWYVSFANRKLDPLAASMRAELEGQEKA